MTAFRSVRGMRDITGHDARNWRYVEDVLCNEMRAFGYEEVRLPHIEETALFTRSVGEATDIVEKEMYAFEDRNGDAIALRPEGTAGCVRALLEGGMLFNQTQRVFYQGTMYRYERPQKGRYREFYQVGAEAFGTSGPDVDVELIELAWRAWQRLGIAHAVRLEINTLGTPESRQRYRDALVAYVEPHSGELDDDGRRRLVRNPLRVLDSKHEPTRALLADAPVMDDFLDEASRDHFAWLCDALDSLAIPWRRNAHLVRGLDYYTHAVFEWVTDRLGAQGTICAGGRYDGLVEQLGGRSTPAAGFAAGLDRVVLLCEAEDALPPESAVDVYVCFDAPERVTAAQALAQRLRSAAPGLRVRTHVGTGKLKAQMKRADLSGARVAAILGEQEATDGSVTIKPLRTDDPQERIPIERVLTDAALLAGFRADRDSAPTGATRTDTTQ